MTWLYNSTGGSLLLICLMHASNNSFMGNIEIPDASRPLSLVLFFTVYTLLVVALLLRYGPANLASVKRHAYSEG